MKSSIVNYYIEVLDDRAQVALEWLLNTNGYAFLDATSFDPYTRQSSEFSTLESIQADMEGK